MSTVAVKFTPLGKTLPSSPLPTPLASAARPVRTHAAYERSAARTVRLAAKRACLHRRDLPLFEAIIEQRTGAFDPSTSRDRYQEALRELIEAKMKGLPIKPRAVNAPLPVIDLTAALKRSFAQEGSTPKRSTPAAKKAKKGRIRSAPSLVIARFRRGDTQGRGRSPIRNSRGKAAQAGLMGRVSSWSNTSA
jgi:hypothetical protein